ncbi:Hpt domain-containing protein [Bradyrhizobium japonicum]|uniref:Hpt domain-containing protein n=1 Tax=Bradyrhizobium japonicum TaxID=375 RepID=UPI001BA59109|nr:Hpt domain-containing protein [Bradyrhizobium japonicum]MBR0993085.1 Hpt domain-containing protein [Bradyrhizobium japonicum]
MSAQLADVPLFDDLQIALLREALDEDDLAALLAELPQATGAAIEAIKAAASSADLAEVQRAAHVLKGSAGSFGAARLASLAREIELELRGMDEVTESLARLAAVAEQTWAHLPVIVGRPLK